MEEAQRERRAGLELVEQLDEGDLGTVELPGTREHAAVLVGVGVAEHDVLLGTAALNHVADAGQRVELAHDGRRNAQVADGLEQRDDDEVTHRLAIQRAAQQAGFLEQHRRFEQVGDRLGVRNDVVAQGLAAELQVGASRAASKMASSPSVLSE